MSDWKQIFSFTKPERNGIIVLSVLIVGALAYFILQPTLFRPDPVKVEIPGEYRQVQEMKKDSLSTRADAGTDDETNQPDVASIAGSHSVYQQNELFLFNPNGLPEADWIRLGLSPAQARSVKKFEEKGGFFKTKEDVKKLYVISPEKYQQLEPYIVIPVSKDSTARTEKKKSDFIYELNTVDTSQLVKVNGIGPVFAQRIVAYRIRLGGFHHKEQLREVYGIDETKYNSIQSAFKVDSTYITKINVNSAEASDLKRHPYITPAVANAIVNYRKAHGPFRQLSDIKLCRVVTEELYVKIAPYLTI